MLEEGMPRPEEDQPMLEPGASTKLVFGSWYRQSPYFDAARRCGFKACDTYNNVYLPSSYTDPVDEYWHLLNHVALWDVGCERQVEIAGPDAVAFADYLTPRDLTKCSVRHGKYVVVCDDEGGIINDPVLMRIAEDRFWLSTADSDLLLWAKGIAHGGDWDVTIDEPDVSPLQIQGRKSKDVLKVLVGAKVLDLAYYQCMRADVDGIPVIVTRTGWTAEVGYEVYLLDGTRGTDLWEKVMTAGQPFDLRPTGPIDIRRVEAGILNYGSDMTSDNNPYEVGLGWLVDENKDADYIGKEALARLKKTGVRRKLVGIAIEGEPITYVLPEYWDVRKDGTKVGLLTALTYSPRLRKNIGYALVPVEHASLGTRLRADTHAGEREAVVVRKPFVDPKKEIPKS